MRKYLTILYLIAGSAAAHAQETEPPIVIADAYRDTYILVVASGTDEPLTTTGQPVAIVGAGEIERVQGGDIVRVVERLPGVTLTRNGGPGGFAGMRVRGAEAEQLLVLLDGVRVADTAAPAGGFDFGALLPAGISKIELLRGSNSTIWGSQAMGGVLAITTLENNEVRGAAEYGGPETIYAQASAGKSWGPLIWGVDGAFFDNEGVSTAAGGREPDGLRQWQVGGRASVQLVEGFNVRAAARHIDARAELDGFPAPDFVLADTAEYQDTRRADASAGLEWYGDDIELRATWSLSDTKRRSFDPALGNAPVYTTHGRDQRAELRGKWDLADDFTLHFGGEREWSRMATLFDSAQRTHSTGGYVQLGKSIGAILLNAGARVEYHARFGTAWTVGADGAVWLGDDWRLRASYGEGFKAPALFQLLSDFGNLALEPETSRGFDVGIEKGDRNASPHLAVSLFRRHSRNLIDFVSCFGQTEGLCEDRPSGTYDNIGRARAQGVELEAATTIGDGVRLQGVYSYVDAKNRTRGAPNEGSDLARRPRHAATLSLDWTMPWALELGVDLRIVSGSFDDAANFVRLEGYEVVTLRASLPVTEAVELYGRVENLFDEHYQVAAGYGTPGRGAYIGARARF